VKVISFYQRFTVQPTQLRASEIAAIIRQSVPFKLAQFELTFSRFAGIVALAIENQQSQIENPQGL